MAPKEIDFEFGSQLRAARIRSGQSVRELARKVRVDPTYLSKLENFRLPPPGPAVLMRLANALPDDFRSYLDLQREEKKLATIDNEIAKLGARHMQLLEPVWDKVQVDLENITETLFKYPNSPAAWEMKERITGLLEIVLENLNEMKQPTSAKSTEKGKKRKKRSQDSERRS